MLSLSSGGDVKVAGEKMPQFQALLSVVHRGHRLLSDLMLSPRDLELNVSNDGPALHRYVGIINLRVGDWQPEKKHRL